MGTVNIFLGGTGKEIAQDIQSSRDVYHLDISEPIAFDLDGTQRPGVELANLVIAGEETSGRVPSHGKAWADIDVGPAVGPAVGGIGPSISPESVLLAEVGKGFLKSAKPGAGLYALRAHGLGVFSLLFDPAETMAGAGVGNHLRQLITSAVERAKAAGGATRINIVTSTAGGTGAGTFLPLGLWLHERFPDCTLNLVCVSHSAFSRVLVGAPPLVELAQKGRSGTYAALREVSYLEGADPFVGALSERKLPVTSEGLPYRPGGRPFDRAYWFGGRAGQTPRDAFEEAGVLVRVLSADNPAEDLRGALGAHPLQNVGSAAAVEYPKLRLQRRMVYSVLTDAFRRLREPAALPSSGVPDTELIHLLDYLPAAIDRPLGTWLREAAHTALHPTTPRAFGSELGESLAHGVMAATPDPGWDAIQRGVDLMPLGYAATAEPDWQEYVSRITADLQRHANSHQQQLIVTTDTARRNEEGAFNRWLTDKVFSGLLSGDSGAPKSTGEVLALLERLELEAADLDQRIDTDPEPLFQHEQPAEIAELIRRQIEKLDKPDPRPVKATWTQRLIGAVFGLAAAGGVVLATPVVESFLGFLLGDLWTWTAALVAFIAVTTGSVLLQLGGQKRAATLDERRKDAERRLFSLYARQAEILAVTWMVDELRGKRGRGSLFREFREQIRDVLSKVRALDEMYDGLIDRATQAREQSASAPAHVFVEIIEGLENPHISDSVGLELMRRLKVEVSVNTQRRTDRLIFKIDRISSSDEFEFRPASAQVADMIQALGANAGPGADERTADLNRVESLAGTIVHSYLGERLPRDFESALLQSAGGNSTLATELLAQKLGTLVSRALPGGTRPPSLALPGVAAMPVQRRLYGGSEGILAEFAKAMNHPSVSTADRAVLSSYYDRHSVVSTLGEQFTLVDVWQLGGEDWAPHVPSRSPDASAALATYYGAEQNLQPGTQSRDNCFTVLPELLAATKLESASGAIRPLSPAVCARLLGCDLDVTGPTYAELFYLLRTRGLIFAERQGTGADQRDVWVLKDTSGASQRLVSLPVVGVSDPLFGEGRANVVVFDAFVDFMRFSRPTLTRDAAAELPTRTPGTLVFVDEWATNASTTSALQRAAVDTWYAGDVDADSSQMLMIVQSDVATMQSGVLAEDWQRAMSQLVSGARRRGIRKLILAESSR